MQKETGKWPQNPQEVALTTIAVGRLVGYSTQQIRDLESLGAIPVAHRATNGYRRYTQTHVIALRAYRALAAAIGPVPARKIMPTLIGSPLDVAAETIDDLHVVISRQRALVREALRGLETVLTETADPFDEPDAMTIGELAQALGVRPSALRYWEREGLVTPDRAHQSQARVYGARAITEARIVAALRSGGYSIPPIARVLHHVRDTGLTSEAHSALDRRLSDLNARSVALLEASGHLYELLNNHPQP